MKPKGFKVLCWNVDQANREEGHPETMWDVRSPGAADLIRKAAADIVCLVELRSLATSKETPEKFVASFPEYASIIRPYNHYWGCFSMAILYRRDKLFAGDTRVVVMGDNMQTSRLIMFTDFTDKKSGVKFTVGVTHFDLPEDVKWESVRIASAALRDQPLPTFLYGDFNFFDDLEGTEQREKMLESCVDLAYPLGRGTFVGFPHDEFKKSPGNYSRLDHVFMLGGYLSGAWRASPPYSPFLDEYKLDNSSYETYTYPSDHLAIAFTVYPQ
jgi:endonuclease/exonuclease/phosphatase family metal-dependent hydrolase